VGRQKAAHEVSVLMRDKDESTTTYSLQFLLWLFCRSPLLEGSRAVFTTSIRITIKALLPSYHDISNYLILILPHSYIQLRYQIIENFVSLWQGHSWLEIIKRYLQKHLSFVFISFFPLKSKPAPTNMTLLQLRLVYHT
jgi:hypothetical protein